jgi:hypothetical protein
LAALNFENRKFSLDYFKVDYADIVLKRLYNLNSYFSDNSLDLFFSSNRFHKVVSSSYFNIDNFVSSFNSSWNEVTSLDTYGLLGNVKLPADLLY